MSRPLRNGFLFGLLLGVTAAGVSLTPLGTALEREFGLAWLFHARGAREGPERVLVVGVDSRSTLLLAGTPIRSELPRTVYAELVDALVARNASAIAFDLFFRYPRPGEDEALARALRQARRVVLFERWNRQSFRVGGRDDRIDVVHSEPPTARLEEAATALAPFLIPAVVDDYLPTLPVATLTLDAFRTLAPAARDAFAALLTEAGVGEPGEALAGADTFDRFAGRLIALRTASLDDRALWPRLSTRLRACGGGGPCGAHGPLLERLAGVHAGPGERLVNHYGPSPAVVRVPLYLALRKGALAADLSGTAVFVGATEFAEGEFPELDSEVLRYAGSGNLPPPGETMDSHATVFGRVPGVEIAATIYANLRHGDTLLAPGRSSTAGLLLAAGVIMGILAFALPGIWAAGAIACLVGAMGGVAFWAFNGHDVWLPLSGALVLEAPLALAVGLLVQYAGASRTGRRISAALGYYVPERLVQSATAGEMPLADAEEMQGVCLSTDVEQYTTLSEHVSAGTLARTLSDYYRGLGEVVERRQGEIVDFVADSMMALWGAGDGVRTEPIAREHRLRACLAALDVRDAADSFNRLHSERPFRTRIGLHAGRLAVGNVGGGRHFDYGVIGDVPNTATRIEGLNKVLGTSILASEAVTAGLDELLLRPVGTYRFKNKTELLRIWEIVGMREQAAPRLEELCERFADALANVEAHRWQEACERFAILCEAYPEDAAARFWHERCRARPSAQDETFVALTDK
jgi:adenylate cyclase